MDQSIREASDFGRPAALQEESLVSNSFDMITKELAKQVIQRNKNLPPTKVVQITTMTGCSEVNK